MKQEGKEGGNECRLPAPAGYRCIRLVRWYLDRIRKDTRPVFRNTVKMNTCVPDLVPEMFVPDVPFKSLRDTERNGKEHALQKRTVRNGQDFFASDKPVLQVRCPSQWPTKPNRTTEKQIASRNRKKTK